MHIRRRGARSLSQRAQYRSPGLSGDERIVPQLQQIFQARRRLVVDALSLPITRA